MEFLITSDGDWLVSGSKELEARIGYPDPDFDLTGFAVRNLGYIEVVWQDPTRVRVRLHPDQVAVGALASLKARQETFGTATVELQWLSSAWNEERFTDAASALLRMDALAGAATMGKSRYHAEHQDIALLNGAVGNPLKLMLQKWRVSFHRFSESVLPFAMQHGLFSRLAIVGVKEQAPDPVFRFLGEGFAPLYGESFVANAPGEKVENQPDKEYALWVRDFYRDVGIRKEPRYDVVDAIVPQAQRGPFLRYERLLLPWETPSGEVFVTLSSHMLTCSGPANDVEPAALADVLTPPRRPTQAPLPASVRERSASPGTI